MYITDVWGVVYKIDVRAGNQGKVLWKMDPGQQKPDRNRGVALWNNLVISVASIDSRVVATDKETGKIVWDKNLRDHPDMFITAAPLALKDRIIIGASGGSTEFVPNLLNALIGTKFSIVKGYKSTSDVMPAIERGEVEGLCGWGWDSARVNGRDYLARGVISVGLECANERNPELAARGVPFMMDLTPDEETKKVLSFLFAYLVYIRPFVAPPGIPGERLKALQDAFAATLKDPELLAEAERAGVEIRYASPERVRAALAQIFDAPDAIKTRALDELRKAGWEGLQR